MRRSGFRALLLFSLAFAISACSHSRVIKVTVTNTSAERVSTIVIDYPDATFGINSLEPGRSFEYKIKPTGTGALKIDFRNSRGVERVSAGPVVRKDDEGSIQIKLTQDGVTSEIDLNARK